jgi:hypothetical protein
LYVATLPPTPAALPGPFDAESAWWGLWSMTTIPLWLGWFGAGLVLLSIIWGWRQLGLAPAIDWSVRQIWLWFSAAVLFVAFWLFPIVHTRWGDAYILANAIGWPEPAMRLTHSWQAPLDVYLHSRLWHWLSGPLGWADAIPAYRLLSPLAGALYLLFVLQLSEARRLAPNWLTFGLLASLGLIQLFFGYIENYSFAAAGILAYLWLGLGVLQGKRPLWLAASVLALTNATHPSTVIYTPSLLYLAVSQWQLTVGSRQDEGRMLSSLFRLLCAITLPMLAVAGATVLLMENGGHGINALLTADRPGGGDGRWLVPIFATTTRWEHYTMFSWLHLRDFLNQQLLVAPVILPGILIGWIGTICTQKRLISKDEDANVDSATGRFLLWAAVCHLLFIWFWNPDYGGQRDWDLFSLAAIPSTLLLIWMLPRILPNARLQRAAVVPGIVLQALHTTAWIYHNRLPWQWP